MSKTGGPLRSAFIWSYERGTIPYDILCALILLFIFLVPRSCFIAQDVNAPPPAAIEADEAVAEDEPAPPRGSGKL
jgi:hypothetical protein